MYARSLRLPDNVSVFLFGPRGTGKSTWIRQQLPHSTYFDLLESSTYRELLARPARIESIAAAAEHTRSKGDRSPRTVVIDEVQKLPMLLDEVHRLIEKNKWRFVLTGSSARKLRRGGANLLAGRARTLTMHPLTVEELGADFDLKAAIRYGLLPTATTAKDPEKFLQGYVGSYLREEILAESLVRNLDTFHRFLEAASFSQASVLNMVSVARDVGASRKTVEGYFDLLEDLLLAVRLPVFARRAKRELMVHRKFFFFDAGVYRALRPKGPLDSVEELDGAAIETLVMQELRATIANHELRQELYYWRTRLHQEVDFVVYGEDTFLAIEVTRSPIFREADLRGMELFLSDYPEAEGILLYGGTRRYRKDRIRVLPLLQGLRDLPEILQRRKK